MAAEYYDRLKTYLQAKVPLTEEECEEILSCFAVKSYKKKQYIIQPGFVAGHRNFVIKGAIRAFVIDDNGVDHTIQLAISDWWISDYNSYIYQKPATMFVSPLEDSVVLQISYENEARLKRSNYKYETFFRILAERSVAFFQRRIIASLTQSAEERYNDFLAAYPSLVQQLPQYAIASYLGMSTEFLSKIRNKKVKKKT
ncbi:MAG TPA: Crp/Fnr family transcriptional regulator [Puia sp.]|jgi:signal-transduction protein with cAMP-binding, CBS, and nucleotidyltransferase domain|nr:Crp/Fnr family transcriptional regulator [Puia sp.]